MLLISAVIDGMHRPFFFHDSDTQGEEGWKMLIYSIGLRLIWNTLTDVENL